MKRNIFGEPRPTNREEIDEALAELDLSAADVYAIVSFNEEDGWAAEVLESIDGENTFTTMPYETKEQLVEDLRALGIDQIEEND